MVEWSQLASADPLELGWPFRVVPDWASGGRTLVSLVRTCAPLRMVCLYIFLSQPQGNHLPCEQPSR